MVAEYGENGGAPHLDGMYTIFGEVVEGFDVLEMIGAEETPRSQGERTNTSLFDQPVASVVMQVIPLPTDYSPADNQPD